MNVQSIAWYTSDLQIHLNVAIGEARSGAESLAGSRDHAHADRLIRELVHSHELARELSRDLTVERARHLHDLLHGLRTFADSADMRLRLQLRVGVELDRACGHIDVIYRTLEDVAALAAQERRQVRPRMSWVATRVIHVALRLLPVTHQVRYAREFAAELDETAQISRRAQWSYAFHVLLTVWPLRRALKLADRLPAPEG